MVFVALSGAAACGGLVCAARRADADEQVRRLRATVRWTVPDPWRTRLLAALRAADIDVAPEVAVQTWVIAVAGVGLLGMIVVSIPFAVVAMGIAAAAMPIALYFARARHERRFATTLPGALEQVAAELRGGGSVAGAVEHLAASASPVASDARRVHTRTRLGLSLADALDAWPNEHDVPGVRAAAGALAVAAEMGGRAADAIDGLAASLRHRLDAIAEARALSTQARLSAVVVGAAPLGYLAFASLVDPRAVDALVATGVGRICLGVGLALEALAAMWIRRIVASEAS